MFDVGLLSNLAMEMGTGKAAGLHGLISEHLKNSHPFIFTILCKLFNQCLMIGWTPPAFSVSYTVPEMLEVDRYHFQIFVESL